MARLPCLEADQVAPEYRDMLQVKIDNEPCYKEVLAQYPIPGVK